MNELLTIVEHAEIPVSKTRDLKNGVISEEDRNLLFDVVYKDKKGTSRYIFSHKGKDKIKARSIVGSVSLKNGLTVEILPKFAKGELTKDSIKRHRKTLVNMIRVSNEKNFITSYSQSSKISMEEMPLINFIIELFTVSLLDNLRQGLYTSYSKDINNSSYIRGNILVSKTIQNNFIDKSKIYTSYNKHSSNNLLMQVFRSLAKILLQDENLSYKTRQNLHEIYLILNGVDIINLKSEDFQKVIFNRLNDKYEVLFNQASYIYNRYMPFSSKINATPFWSILYDMDYLFEKFVAYLFRKSDIEFKEQNTTDCFREQNTTNCFKDKVVSARPDFIIENKMDLFNKKIISVVDAKWKLLSNDKSLYGLNSQNFWQMFSYMNLLNQEEEINGYFIVPKNTNKFEDEIDFQPIIQNNQSIKIISIDFSLNFEDIIKNHKYKINNNKVELDYFLDICNDKRIFTKPMNLENIKEFEFIGFITSEKIIYLKKVNDLFEYFSTDSNLEGSTYFKIAIYKKSLNKSINNFLKLHNKRTLYFSSLNIKNKLFGNIKELKSLSYAESVIISSTYYTSKILESLRSSNNFYFAIDFYESNNSKIKKLYDNNKETIDKLISNFYTLKDKEQTFNAINYYKEKLKKENKNGHVTEVLNLEIEKYDAYIPLEESEIKLCYSEDENEILKLVNNRDIKDELKIILFYRRYENPLFKEEVQKIIKINSSNNLNQIFKSTIPIFIEVINRNYSKIPEKYLYGFIYCKNNEYIHAIKETIAENTTSKEIIAILSSEKEERKIMYSILDNYNIQNNEYIVDNQIIEKIHKYAVEQTNIAMVLKILKRKEISLKLVQETLKYFKNSDVINLIKKINYNDESIISWVNLIDKFNLDNYLNFSTDDKIDFAIEAHFQYYDNDLIKKLCYETDYDILGEILADKHNTLPLRFILLIYILNFKDDSFKGKYLFPAVEDKKNDMLTNIIDLHEKNDIYNVLKYIEENFNNIDNEILFGYAMSNNEEIYFIREKICYLTNDLNLLDEFSKNKDDESILISIINHHRNNPTFMKMIKGNYTKYSLETLDRISKYNEYYSFNDSTCLIAEVANNYNLNIATRDYLFNTYKNDKVILKALNNESLDWDKKLIELKILLINALGLIESNYPSVDRNDVNILEQADENIVKKDKIEFDFEEYIEDNLNTESIILNKLAIKNIPSTIQKLKNLKILNLQDNNIETLPTELFSLEKLEVLNLGNNNIKVIPAYIEIFKYYKKLKELSISGNKGIKLSLEILWITFLKKVIVDKTIIDRTTIIFQELMRTNIQVVDENNNDLSEYIKNIENLNNDNIIKTCSICDKELTLDKFGYSDLKSGKNGYDSQCKLCDNQRGRDRSKKLKPIIKERYNSLKKKAKKEDKNLNFDNEKFEFFLVHSDIFEELYNKWTDSEEQGERNKDLKPNCYIINEKLDYDLDNIKIATTKEVLKIHNESIQGENGKEIIQCNKNGEKIRDFKCIQDAERYLQKLNNDKRKYNTGISRSLKDKNNKKTAYDCVWKYKVNSIKKEPYNKELEEKKNIQLISDNEITRELLIELRKNTISKKFQIDEKCILSPAMIKAFLEFKPINGEEFLLKISKKLRENIDINQMQFIDEIFEILEMVDE